MQVQKTLPKNEGFFSRYAALIPTLFKVGYLSQAFSAAIECYILYAILRPKFDGLADHPTAYALAASLFLVVLLEVGLRGTSTYAARAVLFRRFTGLDLVMTAFIFLLCASLLVCSIALHIGGAKEAVEAGDKGPQIERAGHVDTAYQRAEAVALRTYASDSAAVVSTYAAQITAAKNSTAARARAKAAESTKERSTAADVARIRADGATAVAELEAKRGAALSALVDHKNATLSAAASRRDQAADKIEGRNDGARNKAEARAAKYSGWLSTFSVLTVLFFLLTIALNEVYLKGSGIEQTAIPNQYFFDPGLLAKFGDAVANKFQYHARAGIEAIERATPAPRQPLTPHPLYDYDGLTPARLRLAAALRATASRNLAAEAPAVSVVVPAPVDDDSEGAEDPTRARNKRPIIDGDFGTAACANPACGQTFARRALNQKYCSAECRTEHHTTQHGGQPFDPNKARFNRARQKRAAKV